MIGLDLPIVLWRGKFDAIVCFGWQYPANLYALLAAKMSGTPYFLLTDTDVRDPGRSRAKRIRHMLLSQVCKHAAGALWTGTFNRDFYVRQGVPHSRLWFSPWSVDNERFAKGDRSRGRRELNLRTDTCYFLFVGKLIPRKQPLLLVSAVAELQRQGWQVGLMMAGSGPLSGDVEAAAAEEQLKNFIPLGFVNQRDLPDVYAAADVFVLPSIKDPRATVVNEAMAAGLPVIVSTGTGVWGPGDLVQHGREGLVFESGSVESLRRACEMLAEPARREEAARAATERIRVWSYGVAIEGWRDAVRSVRSATRARRSTFGRRQRSSTTWTGEG